MEYHELFFCSNLFFGNGFNFLPKQNQVIRCLYALLTITICLSHYVHYLICEGSDGFGSQVNKCLENAAYLYDQLQKRTEFELVFKNKVSVLFTDIFPEIVIL